MWRKGRGKFAAAGLAIAFVLVPSIVFADTNVQTKICSPFNAPSITAPASGSSTSDSSLHLVGYADPGLVVSIQKNGAGSGATTATSDGSYAINVPLDTGNNDLVASHTDDCNTVKKSATVQAMRIAVVTPSSPDSNTPANTPVVGSPITQAKPVEVKTLTTAPAVVTTTDTTDPITAASQSAAQEEAKKAIIAEPKPGEVLSSERTWITGKTTPVTKVDIYVNRAVAASVVSADDGVYGALVSIKPGKNTIQVQATAADGTVLIVHTIDVQLVKKTGEDTANTNKDEIKGVKDIAGWVAIGAIGVGGVCVMSFILWHTHQLRLGRKK